MNEEKQTGPAGQTARRKLALARRLTTEVRAVAARCARPETPAAVTIAGAGIAGALSDTIWKLIEEAGQSGPGTGTTQDQRLGEYRESATAARSASRLAGNLKDAGDESRQILRSALAPERWAAEPGRLEEFRNSMYWLQACLKAQAATEIAEQIVEECVQNTGRDALCQEQMALAAHEAADALRRMESLPPPRRPYIEDSQRPYMEAAQESAKRAVETALSIHRVQEWLHQTAHASSNRNAESDAGNPE